MHEPLPLQQQLQHDPRSVEQAWQEDTRVGRKNIQTSHEYFDQCAWSVISDCRTNADAHKQEKHPVDPGSQMSEEHGRRTRVRSHSSTKKEASRCTKASKREEKHRRTRVSPIEETASAIKPITKSYNEPKGILEKRNLPSVRSSRFETRVDGGIPSRHEDQERNREEDESGAFEDLKRFVRLKKEESRAQISKRNSASFLHCFENINKLVAILGDTNRTKWEKETNKECSVTKLMKKLGKSCSPKRKDHSFSELALLLERSNRQLMRSWSKYSKAAATNRVRADFARADLLDKIYSMMQILDNAQLALSASADEDLKLFTLVALAKEDLSRQWTKM